MWFSMTIWPIAGKCRSVPHGWVPAETPRSVVSFRRTNKTGEPCGSPSSVLLLFSSLFLIEIDQAACPALRRRRVKAAAPIAIANSPSVAGSGTFAGGAPTSPSRTPQTFR
jgi:hypothetical protein